MNKPVQLTISCLPHETLEEGETFHVSVDFPSQIASVVVHALTFGWVENFWNA